MKLLDNATCAGCGKQVSIYSQERHGWLALAGDNPMLLDFCGWRCLAKYSAARARRCVVSGAGSQMATGARPAK